jgi:hypothetical protein
LLKSPQAAVAVSSPDSIIVTLAGLDHRDEFLGLTPDHGPVLELDRGQQRLAGELDVVGALDPMEDDSPGR